MIVKAIRKILPVFVIAPLFMETRPVESLYPLATVVIEIDAEKDLVALEDNAGNLWAFEGVEDWELGDVCACIIGDNGTENISDDHIVSAKYCGNLEK